MVKPQPLLAIVFALSTSGVCACGGIVVGDDPDAAAPIVDAAPDVAPDIAPDVAPDVAKPFCPSSLPAAGTACVPTISCKYDCNAGVGGSATCEEGTRTWSVTKKDCDPIGDPCRSSADCEGGAETAYCGEVFELGPLSPTPTCFGTSCKLRTGDEPSFCGDSTEAICVDNRGATGEGTLCLGACTFDGSGAPPKGCHGKDECHPQSWRKSDTGALEGFGFCIGGCRTDADCPTGTECVFEGRYCAWKGALTLPRKKQNEPCSGGDGGGKSWVCNCIFDRPSLDGYCARACTVGESCGPGLACDPMLPPAFTVLPKGASGACLMTCTGDATCPKGTSCKQSGGIAQKTCQPIHPMF